MEGSQGICDIVAVKHILQTSIYVTLSYTICLSSKQNQLFTSYPCYLSLFHTSYLKL